MIRGAFQRHGGSNGGVEAGDLTGLALGLGRAGGGLGRGDGGDLFGAVGAASIELQRVPAEAETAQDDRAGRQGGDADGQPTDRRQAPKDDRRRHGNTFRSSSKCGPSRRRGQSPPQTKATPRSRAAALMASAISG